MEATASLSLSLQSNTWSGFEKSCRNPSGFLRISRKNAVERDIQTLNLQNSRFRRASVRSKHATLAISCSVKKSTALESGSSYVSVDEARTLKNKAGEVVPHLNERCIYLVGMMGSGKTTVGKILSQVLGYSFLDSDKLVEEAVGATSVAQIFEDYSESFFRDNESKVLQNLSSMRRLVVATGGGAVIRPVNWRYMRQGVTVWLDVPLEALARRIAAVGIDSRPLLHQESGDPYTKAFKRLTMLFKERGEAYANAHARVSLQHIASKQGHDVCALTPTAIAIEKNAWLSVPQFGDWDQKHQMPDCSLDFSKIRETRKQNKKDISRQALGMKRSLSPRTTISMSQFIPITMSRFIPITHIMLTIPLVEGRDSLATSIAV